MGDALLQFQGTIFEKGYGQVAKMVMQDSNLSKFSKLVYGYICTFGSGAFPGRQRICSDLGIGHTTLTKSLRELVKNGYLTIEQKRSTDGKFLHNLYVVELIKK